LPDLITLYSIAMVSPAEGWAVGGSGGIFHFSDGHWAKVSSPVTHPLYDIAIISPDNAWAVGIGGALLHYRNGSWQQETRVVWSNAAKDEWT
jgi:photosystem II stability/assembly factor-like uncharacterized protein